MDKGNNLQDHMAVIEGNLEEKIEATMSQVVDIKKKRTKTSGTALLTQLFMALLRRLTTCQSKYGHLVIEFHVALSDPKP